MNQAVTIEPVPVAEAISRRLPDGVRYLRLITWETDPEYAECRTIVDIFEYPASFLASQVGKTDRSKRDFMLYRDFVISGAAIRAALAKLEG